MTHKTIIFGNGLGMALDPQFFSLDKAIGRIWDDEGLDATQKALICQCLPRQDRDRPHDENDMDALQLALSACDLLNGLGASHIDWLTSDGRKFPSAVRQLFYKVASSFHQFNGGLPDDFSNAFAEFLRDTKSHVATLNYDNLIYRPLIDRDVLKGYDGALCDGFYSTGFEPENLERKNGHDFGYYLHLHGSPLFVERNGATVKLSQGELANNSTDTVSSHIVLTHVEHKQAVIGASQLLITYWEYLDRAFQESDEIVVVGYSGLDVHLNERLKTWLPSKRLRVVEWNGAGDESTRRAFWSDALGKPDIGLVQLPSILTFTEWAVVGAS